MSAAAVIIAAGSSSSLVTWAAVVSPIIATAFGAYLTWRLRQVHTIVNAQRTAHEARIDQLAAAMKAAGLDVPDATRETGRL